MLSMTNQYFLAAEAPALVTDSPSPFQGPIIPAHSKNKHILGAVIIASVILSLVTSLLIFFRRRLLPYFRRRTKSEGKLKDEEISLRRFQFEELVRATNNFSDEFLLGSGAFGNVYKGIFDVEGTLAIKRPHADSFQSVEEFRNEVRLLSKVKHRNLVGLMGFCEETGGRKAKVLVYEYVPNGSLLEYIIGKGGRSLTWRQRVHIAIGAAKGIAHLHSVKPSIIHRDIKPSNILIGREFEAKISDFGLVKMGPIGDQSHVSSQIKGTPGYLDPAYCTSCHLSPSSDVYSFGVILLQLVASRPAVDSSRNQSNFHIIEWARPSLEKGNVAEILDANLLIKPCNMEMMLNMGQLGLKCVVQNPKNRPTMTQVWQELEEALYLSDRSFISKEPSKRSQLSSDRWSHRHGHGRSTDIDTSQSFVSIDGVGLQRFHIELDNLSFQSANLRCFEASSVSIDIDKNNFKGVSEGTGKQKDNR